MELEWLWPGSSLKVQWGPGNGRGWVNGFQTRTIEVADEYLDIQAPITDIQLEIINVTIEYRCP